MNKAMRSFVKNLKLRRQSIIWTLFAFACLLALWQYGSVVSTGRIQLPSPLAVFEAFFRSLSEPIGRYTTITHVLISLYRVGIGLALATVTGIITGVAMGYSRSIEAFVKPVFEFLRPIPPLAWIPLSILWFGLGTPNKVFIVFLGSFSFITINAYEGARNVDPDLVGAARMLGANPIQVFTRIVLPSSVPDIFSGLQVAVTTSWSAVVAAEIIHSEEGAGWIIVMGMNNGNTVQILVGMIAIGVVGFVLAAVMRWAERRLCSWNRKEA